jgi:hypothetical protein
MAPKVECFLSRSMALRNGEYADIQFMNTPDELEKIAMHCVAKGDPFAVEAQYPNYKVVVADAHYVYVLPQQLWLHNAFSQYAKWKQFCDNQMDVFIDQTFLHCNREKDGNKCYSFGNIFSVHAIILTESNFRDFMNSTDFQLMLGRKLQNVEFVKTPESGQYLLTNYEFRLCDAK